MHFSCAIPFGIAIFFTGKTRRRDLTAPKTSRRPAYLAGTSMDTAPCWRSSHKAGSRCSVTARLTRTLRSCARRSSNVADSSRSPAPNEQHMGEKSRVLILGGGFSGLYAALEFERWKNSDIEVTLVNRDNFFLFTPMLHEIAAIDLDIMNIIHPVRKMLRHVDFFAGDVESIDLEKRAVVVSHGFDHHTHTLEYDHLVLALGSITNFFKIPGLEARAFTMKSLGGAIQLRNRLIAHLEEADTECAAKEREALLTFVVAGGGFAGVETIASINDLLKEALPYYPNLRSEMIRVVLVDPGEFVLPELGEQLGRYAGRKLTERGVEIRPNTKIKAVTSSGVELSDGTHINTRTLVWTAGTAPNPAIDLLDCPKERGRLKVNE